MKYLVNYDSRESKPLYFYESFVVWRQYEVKVHTIGKIIQELQFKTFC
jgi:hypothetical protein